jgi:hypothetical protein
MRGNHGSSDRCRLLRTTCQHHARQHGVGVFEVDIVHGQPEALGGDLCLRS